MNLADTIAILRADGDARAIAAAAAALELTQAVREGALYSQGEDTWNGRYNEDGDYETFFVAGDLAGVNPVAPY